MTHALPRTRAADDAAFSLFQRVRSSGRFDFASPVADPRFALATKYAPFGQGIMAGVLLASDSAGHVHTLRAFSGQLNGAWLVDGWAPPLCTFRHDTSHAYRLTVRRIVALGAPARAAAAEAKADALRGASDARDAAARAASARKAQQAVSRALSARIWASYAVRNWRGEVRGLPGAAGAAAPCGGTGDCAAPKLLNMAHAMGLRPLSMAEMWIGGPPPGGGKAEGTLYPACVERCEPILGYMLCGLQDGAPKAGGGR